MVGHNEKSLPEEQSTRWARARVADGAGFNGKRQKREKDHRFADRRFK
jgi:hypothetical protein